MTDTNERPPGQVMFQMVTGFWVSQAIGAFARLDLADTMAAAPTSVDALAKQCGAHPGTLLRLLRALTTVGVARREPDGRFALTPLGATLKKGPGTMRGMAIAQTGDGHWLPWGRLTDAVRTGENQARATLGHDLFEHYATHPDEGAAFGEAMDGLAEMVAKEIAPIVGDLGKARIVDVGGSTGTVVSALLRASPSATGVVLDLPETVDRARAAVAARGVGARCEVVGGDFFAAVPDGDLLVLKQVLHDWNDAQCTKLLGRVAAALRPGGRVAIVEMVLPDDGGPSPANLMDLNMLVLVPGQERTSAEYRALLQSAGLSLTGVHATHSPFSVLIAERRAA